MLDLLQWLVDSIDRGEWKCPECTKPIKRENITASGIMKSEKFRNRTVHFISYDCPDCGSKSIISFNRMTVEEYVMEMHEQYHNPVKKEVEDTKISKTSENAEVEDKSLNKAGKEVKPASDKNNDLQKKSKITQKEVDDFKNKLENCKTHEEFMHYIGLTKEEIEEMEGHSE